MESPYSLSPIGQDSPLGLISPKMTHRKIARSPFKVSPGRARHVKCCSQFRPRRGYERCSTTGLALERNGYSAVL